MKLSDERKNIFKALTNFRKDFKQPSKDADNPFFKSKYVPLESVVQSIDKVVPKHGLAYVQSTITNDQGQAGVITLITHESGEFIELDPLFLRADKQTAQGMGSAITYARRYSLSSAFGVASDVDDDGNEASQPAKQSGKNMTPSQGDFILEADKIREQILKAQPDSSAKGINEYIYKKMGVKGIDEIQGNRRGEMLALLEQLLAQARSKKKD